jgi:hypothetical protein
MKKLVVRYLANADTEMVPDGKAQEYAEKIVRDANSATYNTVLLTCQELVVDYIRLAILKKLIPHTDVEFLFESNVIFSDKYGHLDWWPDGFCDYRDKLLSEMLQDMFYVHQKGE